MALQRLTRLLCASDPRGSEGAVQRLLDAADRHDAQAVALVGDLSGSERVAEAVRTLLKAIAAGGRPTYWVPGPRDAPVSEVLQQAHNMEVVVPNLHCIHGTLSFATKHMIFAGLGGEVSDDPGAPRDEVERLRYPRWEPEFRLKQLGELGEYQKVLVFWSRPAHKGSQGDDGVEVLSELVNTHRPRVVICGGERGTSMLGGSRVVAPGRLVDGHYALVDSQSQEAELEQLAGAGI